MAKKGNREQLFEVGDHQEAARRISHGEDQVQCLAPCLGRSHWRFFRGESSCSRDAMEFSLRQDWLNKALGQGAKLAKALGGEPEALVHALKFRGRTIVVQTSLIDEARPWEKLFKVRWGVAVPTAKRSAEEPASTRDFWAEFCFRMKTALAEEPEKFAANIESCEIAKASTMACAEPRAPKRLRI